MHPIQALLNGMSQEGQRKRSQTQMTLGQLITRLENMPADATTTLCNLHSYRGYYSDLALEEGPKREISTLLAECRAAMGQVFEGYKGGDFMMGALTPMWVASYGSTGEKLVTLYDNGSFETKADDYES